VGSAGARGGQDDKPDVDVEPIKSLLAARMRRVAHLPGDGRTANDTAADLPESFGFAPVDLPSLRTGGRIRAGGPITGHDFCLPWPVPRSFPVVNGEAGTK
jgi:8-hydroxy-5-deazaflavin:NADPH oxidoreductase